MNTQELSTQALPWYKQFWPWFLVAIPFSSVIMGVVMIWLAVSGKDSLVKEDWYKDGMAINQELDKQNKAQQLGIHAFLTVDKNRNALFVELNNIDIRKVPELLIEFSHPTLEDKDFTLNLYLTPEQKYYSVLPRPVEGFYYATLAASGFDWEILSGVNFSNQLDHVALHKVK